MRSIPDAPAMALKDLSIFFLYTLFFSRVGQVSDGKVVAVEDFFCLVLFIISISST